MLCMRAIGCPNVYSANHNDPPTLNLNAVNGLYYREASYLTIYYMYVKWSNF